MASEARQQYEPVSANDQELEGYNGDQDSSPLLTPSGSPTEDAHPGRDLAARSPEESPFLGPRQSNDEDDLDDPLDGSRSMEWSQEGGEESKSMSYLFILTLSIGGLQIAWATELSNGSPFLLSLGLSKSFLSFVWIAGPLMGVLVQPYVGILSDRSRSKWGKRRPFMVGFAIATTISFFALAWSSAIVTGVLGIFGADPDSHGVQVSTIAWAVIWVYILDFAINAVQAAIRAFIVDNAPTHQQEDANAWAGRMTGFGSILGYLSGYVHLPNTFPFFGDTQFKVLSVFASIALCVTVTISCFFIKERDPRLEGEPQQRGALGVISFFTQTYRSMKRLSPQIRKICEVQFFNWIGWFPFLFYTTTYIGQLYMNPILEENPDLPPDELARYWDDATRIGSFALFINALVSFAASILLPILVVPSYDAGVPLEESTTSLAVARFYRFIHRLRIPGLTLRRAWMLSHVLFAACMASTFVVSTPTGGTVTVALVGVAWALTMWAPFALISAEISKRDTLRRAGKAPSMRGDGASGGHTPMAASESGSVRSGLKPAHEYDQAGIVLGLHNVAVSAPQILATLISSAIFKVLQRDRGSPGDESVSWVLRFGGLAALVAAFMTWRLEEAVAGSALRQDDREDV